MTWQLNCCAACSLLAARVRECTRVHCTTSPAKLQFTSPCPEETLCGTVRSTWWKILSSRQMTASKMKISRKNVRWSISSTSRLWSVRLPHSIYPLVYCCFRIKTICSQGSSWLVHFDPVFWGSCAGNSLQDTGYPVAIVLYDSRDLLTCPIFFFFNFLNFSREAASISGESTFIRYTGTKLFVTPNISYSKQFN